MKYIAFLVLLLFVLNISCNTTPSPDQIDQWKAEISAAEQSFNDMAQEKGLAEAFDYYAAPDGVIRRGNKVIQGHEAIKAWHEKDFRPNETLEWKPTFIDVSQSGDLGYTYGDYIFTTQDSLGNKKESKGLFHTVWKRQSDGSWKYVWD